MIEIMKASFSETRLTKKDPSKNMKSPMWMNTSGKKQEIRTPVAVKKDQNIKNNEVAARDSPCYSTITHNTACMIQGRLCGVIFIQEWQTVIASLSRGRTLPAWKGQPATPCNWKLRCRTPHSANKSLQLLNSFHDAK